MGYTTDFEGTLKFNKPITEELKTYINKFSEVRHMTRNNKEIKKIFPDWEQKCYKGQLGKEGEYFVGGKGLFGQDQDDSVLKYNYPPNSQPGLWCQWIINDDGELEWNGAEKFYYYVEWLEYLIKNFFEPEGYVLNGKIYFQGEDIQDRGDIVVTNNKVHIVKAGPTDFGELTNKQLEAFYAFIDYMEEQEGNQKAVVSFLIEQGFTKSELLYLEFDEDTIDYVFDNLGI